MSESEVYVGKARKIEIWGIGCEVDHEAGPLRYFPTTPESLSSSEWGRSVSPLVLGAKNYYNDAVTRTDIACSCILEE